MFKNDRQRKAVFSRLNSSSSFNRFSAFSRSKEESIADGDHILAHGGLSDNQKKMFEGIKKQYSEGKMSRHPQEIGSVWVGGDYVHGPRIAQPGDFEFIKNVDPSPKFFHLEGADKIPKKLPKGSKLVVGKLRHGGEWAIQSTLIPKKSNLGRSLIKSKGVI